MDNPTVKMVEDQPGDDVGRMEEDPLIKQELNYTANWDNGQTSIWVDDIESDDEVKPQLPSGFDLGGEAEKQITSPVKKKIKLGNGEADDVENVPVTPDDSESEDEEPLECSWDCIHAKQNELLKEAVYQLSVRNTLLEDFIQVEFGERFHEFEIKRERLLNMGFGDTGKETSGKRSRKSAEVVDLLRLIKESENGERHSGNTASSTHHASINEDILKPTTSTDPDAAKKNNTVEDEGRVASVALIKSSQIEPISKANSYSSSETLEEPKKDKQEHGIDRIPEAISTQNLATDVVSDVAKALRDGTLIPKVVPASSSATSSTQSSSTNKCLWDLSADDESSDEEEEINGLTLPQLLKWQNLPKKRTLALCPVCKETLRMKNMRDHLMIVHKAVKLSCPIENCGVESQTRGIFKKHLIDKHSWTEDKYSDLLKVLEKPVLPWLAKILSAVVLISMDNVIIQKKVKADAKMRTERIISRPVDITASNPIPQTWQPPLPNPARMSLPPTLILANSLPALFPPTQPNNSITSSATVDDESSDEDDDIRGVTLPQLFRWQDVGKSRKIAVCTFCKESIKFKNLRDHFLVIHKGIKLTCQVQDCHKESKTRSLFRKHLTQDHFWTDYDVTERINSLEKPVLEWLTNVTRSATHSATTYANAIRKLRRQKKAQRTTRFGSPQRAPAFIPPLFPQNPVQRSLLFPQQPPINLPPFYHPQQPGPARFQQFPTYSTGTTGFNPPS